MKQYSQAELEAFIDEALTPDEMAEIEAQLRTDKALAEQLRHINGRRDAGVHSLGEVWRRHRVSCPSRDELGSFLLGILDAESAEYVSFHLKIVGCRYCNANIEDMQSRQSEMAKNTEQRRRKYFQSSAGYLKND